MDEQALNELLECSVCLEQLDDTSKVLPCQHTFCKRCLEEIVSTKHELRCPECRFLVEMRVDDLPSNILLIRLLEGLKTQSRGPAGQGRKRDNSSPVKGDNSIQSVATFAKQQQQRQAIVGSRPCAKALFNYEAKEAGDLSFKKGDVVYLQKQVDENWYHGEFSGQHGFFPASYVQVITPLPSTIPQCQGLYDFNPGQEDDCLRFKKDEILTVIKKVDENWLEGKKGDKIGIFPISFVQLNEPAKILLSLSDKNSSSPSQIGPPETPVHPGRRKKDGSPLHSTHGSPLHTSQPQNKRHSLTTFPQHINTAPAIHRRSLDSNTVDTDLHATGGGQQVPPAMTSSMTSSTTSAESSLQLPVLPLKKSDIVNKVDEPHSLSSTVPVPDPSLTVPIAGATAAAATASEDSTPAQTTQIYVAMYNYKPQKGDELELIKGDYYSVSEKCQDGWYKGVAIKTSIAGVFPGNYVMSLKTQTKSNKTASTKLPKAPTSNPSNQTSTATNKTISPPRPATSSSEALGRSRSRGDEVRGKSRSEGRTEGDEKNTIPPPIVPRHPHSTSSSLNVKGRSSTSSPNSPVLSTGSKTTRYVRASKSTSPNISVKPEDSGSGSSAGVGGGMGSPVWKHSLSAGANITPPNVVVGPGPQHMAAGAKEKKKEKEKLSLMKRLAGKGKKYKSVEPESDTGINHTRSGSFPSELSVTVVAEGGHKKTGSFDGSSTTQTKPSRPKPLIRETYQCIATYPSQSEIELDLKIGDIVFVHKKRDDGWFKGTLQRSGKMGLFPGNFVVKAS